MLKRLVQICLVLVGGTLGVFLLPDVFRLMNLSHYMIIANPYSSAVLGALIFYLISFWSIHYIVDFVDWFEDSLVKVPITEILSGSLGLIFGLFIAYLVAIPFRGIPIVNTVVPIIFTVLLGYIGFQVGFKKREEFVNLFFNRPHKRKGLTEHEQEGAAPAQAKTMKLLDTSVIIDGRIADICQTGFLDGPIVIPLFVLEELQHIADSSDALKRNRGRRGLDILNRIQNDLPIEVQMYEGDFEDIQEVDSKLIKLAKLTNGIVVTNDYNLNKVCEFQKVRVLNINDLANAVKPVVLPGEELNVQLIKDGKEHHQGIAYLDDGTMIVVEEGKNYIGKRIDVLVTSVLQTSAGRMIFAKPKLLEKAL
ncbi:PIN/TRAM domain-containing protein [Heyndrickxia acidiproducens]|uniref:PIN/TRAM domain-containing protein n=1 Tax=Heyndrickxia acidiproducens TaxID=1121084 RepID=UPI00036A84BB|nr:PIN/TRAM domain-containing protein [Heyndrickxia acidiproducens]